MPHVMMKLTTRFLLCSLGLLVYLAPLASRTAQAAAPAGTVVSWGSMTLPYVESGTRYLKIAAGGYHTVALKNDGTVVAWGQTTVPAGLSGVAAIAAGYKHTVALKNDGTVVAWGDNSSGQTTVPAGLSGVTAIAAGYYHTVALKNDGTVVAWGYNYYGQTTVPAALSGVTAIAAGWSHTVALKNDGTVVAWGYNAYGQRTVPAGLSGVTAIAAGRSLTVALVGTAPPVAPSISTHPASQRVNAGQNASFTVAAIGTAPLTYQWFFNDAPISGATSTTLALNNAQPGNDGRYSVRVSNALGSVTSRSATLSVLGDPANGTPAAPIVTPTAPPKAAGQDSLIIVTHGWQFGLPTDPLADVSWVDDMTNTIQKKLISEGKTNWRVVALKWVPDAQTPHPDNALWNGAVLGALYGKVIGTASWKHVHLIGHSAGAGLIQAAAKQIRNLSQTTTVHTTFLDPFRGLRIDLRDFYGQYADWSDNYYARDLSGSLTRDVPHSHNVDVTDLDPDPDPDRSLVYLIGLHGWPYQFYTRTVTNGFATPQGDTSLGYGFPLSMEGGGWANRGNYPTNTTVRLSGVVPSPFTFPLNLPSNTRPVTDNSKLTVSGVDAIPALISLTGNLQLNGGGFVFQNGNLMPQPQSVRVMGPRSQADGPVLQPAWVSLGVTVTNLVNYVKFDAGFTSTAGAQGLFSVYWGTNLLGSLDERTATTGLQTYRFGLPGTYQDGQYTLGFRLDAYASTASSLTLTNVITGFIGLTNPPSLTVAPNLTNGAPQVTLTGATGFYSILQSSTNLVNWTPIAALVNSNGAVQFTDTALTNESRRFYRAVVP